MTLYQTLKIKQTFGSAKQKMKQAADGTRTHDLLHGKKVKAVTGANSSKRSTPASRLILGISPKWFLLQLLPFSATGTQDGRKNPPECPWCKTPGAANEETDDGRYVCGRCEAVYA